MHIKYSPVLTHSLLVLPVACALAVLPLGRVSAQDSSSTTTRATGTVDPDKAPSERPRLTADETNFIKTAAAGNLAEVELAELALKHSEDKGVKEFAQMMIKDHGTANEELTALAKRSNIDDFKPMLMPEQKATYETLSKLKGKVFDEAYLKDMVEDHEKDSTEYRGAMNKVVDKGVLAYVKKTSSIISEHETMVKKLAKTETKK